MSEYTVPVAERRRWTCEGCPLFQETASDAQWCRHPDHPEGIQGRVVGEFIPDGKWTEEICPLVKGPLLITLGVRP